MTLPYDWNPQMVWVVNHNKDSKLFVDKFAGQPHAFPFGKRVKCTRVAANHFFAIDARERVLMAREKLSGMNTPEAKQELAAAEAWWAEERIRVLTRNSWNLKVLKQADGSTRIEANPKADEILAGFAIEPIIEPSATEEATAQAASA